MIRVPVAHGEGNYQTDGETLARLQGEGRIVFRYCDAEGAVTAEANPNGAQANMIDLYPVATNNLGQHLDNKSVRQYVLHTISCALTAA